MKIKKYSYFPLVKTRDAELKAISKLDDEIFDEILPIYELTKSRKTKIAPDGDIHRKMSTLAEIQGERPFILDVTSNDKYLNPQLEQLLDESNGFYEWQYFIQFYNHLNIIPMIHIYDDEDFFEVKNFIKSIAVKKKTLAIRIPHAVENIEFYLDPIFDCLPADCKLFIILDGEQIIKGNIEKVVDFFINSCKIIDGHNDKVEDVVIISTSFPSSPASLGEDSHGEFPIYEEKIFSKVSEEYPVKYGDYGSINIQQLEIKGGTFVPRIDIALRDTFIYKRYRRTDGSYILCAQEMVKDKKYKPLGVWADKEIKLASNGKPSGISPSFWIAVRMNYHMTSRVNIHSEE